MCYYPRLRQLREQRQLPQKYIAWLLGTTQQQYHKYEKGLQEIPVHHLITLANFYKTSVDYILGVDDAKTKNDL